MDVCRAVDQVHVLLIGCQDLNGLSLDDADLVLLQCTVVLGDHHGGGHAVTTHAVRVLLRGNRRRMGGEEEM